MAQAAREGRFPFINNLVDINNYVSLKYGLPISLLDQAPFGDAVILRIGTPGEKYVFNSAGQEIELDGLVCACNRDGRPLGNAVKDSMEGKIKDSTAAVVGVIYAPAAFDRQKLEEACREFQEMLRLYGGAGQSEYEIL